MADFLRINGIVVPCLEGSGANTGVEQVGESKRAVSGAMLTHRRVVKRKWGFTMTPQLAATALAFRDLVLGRGHYWSYDDTTKGAYSSKGLGPSVSTGNSLGTGTPFLGAGRLQQTASTGQTTYVIGAQRGLTAILARKVGAGAWVHYVKDSASNVWTDGVLTGSAAWLSVSAGAGGVSFVADAASTTLIDELVILPFDIPSDWPAQIYAFAAASKQWGSLAQLNLDGDAIEANSGLIAAKGEVDTLKMMKGSLTAASGFKPNLHTMDMKFEEV